MPSVPYGNNSVELRGNASQLVTLKDTALSAVIWEPLDRRAMDIEVHVALQQLPNMLGGGENFGTPWIRWGMRTGHGTGLIDHPPESFPIMPGALRPKILPSLMPARGLHFRVNTREFHLLFQNTGYTGRGYDLRDLYGEQLEEVGQPGLPSFPPAILSVSFQPVEGVGPVPVLPRYASVVPTEPRWGQYVQFPAAATEWRAFGRDGEPFEQLYDPGPEADAYAEDLELTCVDAMGAGSAWVSLFTLAEWQPIPLRAWAFHAPEWTDAGGFNVEFR
ncbi:MAG TPA: hypothetical protein VFN67_36325 [Polyangiales bacterium]|nr:hypothetical protein [Polyangiales bacterium]